MRESDADGAAGDEGHGLGVLAAGGAGALELNLAVDDLLEGDGDFGGDVADEDDGGSFADGVDGGVDGFGAADGLKGDSRRRSR